MTAALALASGCVVMPIPTPQGKILEGWEVMQSQLAFLRPSLTTKDEATGRLGTPTILWRDENMLVYRWVQRKGILIWAVGGGYSGEAGVTDISSEYALLIKFDPCDRFETFEILRKQGLKSFGQFLLDWRDAKRTEGAGTNQQAP